MESEEQLQAFLANVEKLTLQYELLKQHALNLQDENQRLKQQNIELISKNADAKTAIHDIIDKLKEERMYDK
jgi:hypothetical protein